MLIAHGVYRDAADLKRSKIIISTNYLKKRLSGNFEDNTECRLSQVALQL